MPDPIKQTLFFGSYPFYEDGESAPIEWQVLQERDGRALLISKHCLQWWPFHAHRAVTWEKSHMRSLLNGDFYGEAFSEEERRRILCTTVLTSTELNFDDHPPEPESGTQTGDHVFLLSVWEATRYFPDDAARIAQPTPYARGRGAGLGWWLRSRGVNVSYTSDVLGDGAICPEGEEVYEEGGVRPAIWISV